MASSRHAKKLACHLIETHFGEIVGRVCSCLVHKGILTLPELARFTELSPAQLKSSLLVLIQHNCVQPFKQDTGDGKSDLKCPTQYAVLVNFILQRIRFPKFLSLVCEELGQEVESVFEGLLEHGRLSFDQLRDRAKAQSGKGDLFEEASLQDVFTKLVNSHYIERCPIAEPVLESSLMEQPKKVLRGPARRIKQDNNYETEEQRVAGAACSLQAHRFLVPWSAGEVSENMENCGNKRKYSTFEKDSRTSCTDDKDVLWRVNYEALICSLQHKACVAHVRSRFDIGTGIVLEAMLKATRCSETTKIKQNTSIPLSMGIVEAVQRTKEGHAMTVDRIQAARDLMASSNVGYLSVDSPDNCSIKIYRIIQSTRKSELETIIQKRFGSESCRIFRLLAMKGPLELTQISEQALVGRKETLEILFKLLKDDFLQQQEIAKSNDHNSQKTFYLWRVVESSLMSRVVDDIYHAAFNLLKRLEHELEMEHEVLGLVKQIQQLSKGPDGKQSHITLTKSQDQQYKRIRSVAAILEASLLKLDDSILLFQNF